MNTPRRNAGTRSANIPAAESRAHDAIALPVRRAGSVPVDLDFERSGADLPLMMEAFRSPRSRTAAGANPDLMRKADLCARILAEARKFSELGQFGGLLNQLVVRADELLDDMDEILVAIDPKAGGPFAIAANLHRELELVQAAITAQRRETASMWKGVGNP